MDAKPRVQGRTVFRVLIVDLNNFATFPTLAIGLLVAGLRKNGHDVQVLCPLAHDVPATERERRENWLDQVQRRVHLSTISSLRILRDFARSAHGMWTERPHPIVLKEVSRTLERKPDVVLLSAYLQHFNTVAKIGKLCLERRIPVLLGGPMFNISGTAEEWRKLPGLAAVVGAESDREISALVEALGTGRDLTRFPGLTLPDGNKTLIARPLTRLDDTPVPDFTDFPWDRYRVRIVPVMTGRGCQWGRCTFCSDVVSVNGRTFRTRSVENVLLETREQARRHATTNFLFLDLKLNSYPGMIRGIASEIQRYVQGAEWLGTVHVDLRKDNGLSRSDLFAAVAGGMRRVSFGLESGSQRLLDIMDKGSSVDANSEFIRNAFEAGLSIRCTMFKGFPGESAEDMERTADFLETHAPYLDRIRFNDFSLLADTPIYNALIENARTVPSITVTKLVERKARAEYVDKRRDQRAYRGALGRALRTVYEINRRPVRTTARQFDGLM
jgi:radical SAM superfamily enzyme YgiQ (UPF0313 family)